MRTINCIQSDVEYNQDVIENLYRAASKFLSAAPLKISVILPPHNLIRKLGAIHKWCHFLDKRGQAIRVVPCKYFRPFCIDHFCKLWHFNSFCKIWAFKRFWMYDFKSFCKLWAFKSFRKLRVLKIFCKLRGLKGFCELLSLKKLL